MGAPARRMIHELIVFPLPSIDCVQIHNRAVEADQQAQILFRAQVMLQYAGRNLIFIDESSFDKRTYGRPYGRSKRGHRTKSKTVPTACWTTRSI